MTAVESGLALAAHAARYYAATFLVIELIVTGVVVWVKRQERVR